MKDEVVHVMKSKLKKLPLPNKAFIMKYSIKERSKHPEGFTMIVNSVLRNKNLSWAAKGLHTYLMSLVPEWKINVMELSHNSVSGFHQTRMALKELESAGYVYRKRRQGGYETWVFETRKLMRRYNCKFHNCKFHNCEIHNCENQQLIITDNKIRTENTTTAREEPLFWNKFPDHIRNDKAAAKAWKDWLTYRAQRKCPMTERGTIPVVKAFSALQPSDLVREIEHSINVGWRGLFLKKETESKPGQAFNLPPDMTALSMKRLQEHVDHHDMLQDKNEKERSRLLTELLREYTTFQGVGDHNGDTSVRAAVGSSVSFVHRYLDWLTPDRARFGIPQLVPSGVIGRQFLQELRDYCGRDLKTGRRL